MPGPGHTLSDLRCPWQQAPSKQRVNLKRLPALKGSPSDLLVSTDPIFLSSRTQGATGSGQTPLPFRLSLHTCLLHSFSRVVAQRHETSWFCSVGAAGLSVSAGHS